ncbi:hypothetical protein, partial [Escherichia coli]|uniref:hypothetical protein n=1 Tax=Escherichia coli TaxID=562 RepID=UPI00194582D8
IWTSWSIETVLIIRGGQSLDKKITPKQYGGNIINVFFISFPWYLKGISSGKIPNLIRGM